MPPAPDMDYLRRGVHRFRTETFPTKRDLYVNLAEKQHPQALFLTCGDSRIDPSALTSTEPGEIFVERTPGNIVPIYSDEAAVGVSASIEYSVVVLGVRDIIVCGHSACGAMKGLLDPCRTSPDSRHGAVAPLRRSGVSVAQPELCPSRRPGTPQASKPAQCRSSRFRTSTPTRRSKAG